MSDKLFIRVLPRSDKDYYLSILEISSESNFKLNETRFGNASGLTESDIESDEGIQEVFKLETKAFTRLTFNFGRSSQVLITRAQEKDNSVYDKIEISQGELEETDFALFCALVRSKLDTSSSANLSNFLGEEAQRYYESREIALSKLEKTAADLIDKTEEWRKDLVRETEEKQDSLERAFEEKRVALDAANELKMNEIKSEFEAIEQRKKELDDRASMHARRQHYKEIKEKFDQWNKEFQVTRGTQNLRWHIYYPSIILMVIFGSFAAYFLLQSFQTVDNSHFVAVIVKQIAFTALFVSTATFFIRFNKNWFDKHAEEEFRLKRMEFDVDRASWFVEMAFEWKDEKGEEIPDALIDLLTTGLFSSYTDKSTVEPHDSFIHGLLGASKLNVKIPNVTEVEYDRKSIQKLAKEERNV